MANPNWVKGQSGNPNGRPKGSSIKVLLDAIHRIEAKKGINYWDKVIEKSLTNPAVMVAVMKKIIPDQVENRMIGEFDLVCS